MNKLRPLIIAIVIALLSAGAFMAPAADAQQQELSMPFPPGQTWRMNGANGNNHHGGGYDFYPPTSDGRVTAVGDGVARTVCATPGGQAIIRLIVDGVGEFQYGHIAADNAIVPTDRWVRVTRQETLGYLWTNPERIVYGWEVSPGCMSGQSLDYHLHLNVPYAGIVLDGQRLGSCVFYGCQYTSNSSGLATPNQQHRCLIIADDGRGNTQQVCPKGVKLAPVTPAPVSYSAPPERPKTPPVEQAETVTEWWARLFPNG